MGHSQILGGVGVDSSCFLVTAVITNVSGNKSNFDDVTSAGLILRPSLTF